jgi:hypothetical protein
MLGGPGYPGAGGLHPHSVDGRPGRLQHRPIAGPAPGTVRRDCREAHDPQVVARGIKNPAAFRARARDPPFNIHLHTVGNTVRRRHGSKNAVVAQGTVRGHIEGPNELVRACSGREGLNLTGASPVVPIARFRHVAIPQFEVGNHTFMAWCKRPDCPEDFEPLR